MHKFVQGQRDCFESVAAVSLRRGVGFHRSEFGKEPTGEAVREGTLNLATCAAEEQSSGIGDRMHDHRHVAGSGQVGRNLAEQAWLRVVKSRNAQHKNGGLMLPDRSQEAVRKRTGSPLVGLRVPQAPRGEAVGCQPPTINDGEAGVSWGRDDR